MTFKHSITKISQDMKHVGTRVCSDVRAKRIADALDYVIYPEDMRQDDVVPLSSWFLVSIVVPIYNAEAYLPACFASIVAQSYHNFEVILVDDGSKDASAELCQEMCNKDPRFRFISQENNGASSARNKGMSEALGSVIMFLDADDRYYPHTLERVVKSYEKHHWDVLCFGFDVSPRASRLTTLHALQTPPDKIYYRFESDLMFRDLAKPYIVRCALASTFAKQADVHFDETLGLGEDMAFFFYVYPRSRKTQLMSDHLYEYVMHDDSLAHSLQRNARDARIQKLENHKKVIASVLHDWKGARWARDAVHELLGWACDYVLMDIVQLPSVQQQREATDVLELFCEYTDAQIDTLVDVLEDKLLAHVVALLCEVAQGSRTLSYKDIFLFYVVKRGIWACAKRVLCKLMRRSHYN